MPGEAVGVGMEVLDLGRTHGDTTDTLANLKTNHRVVSIVAPYIPAAAVPLLLLVVCGWLFVGCWWSVVRCRWASQQ